MNYDGDTVLPKEKNISKELLREFTVHLYQWFSRYGDWR